MSTYVDPIFGEIEVIEEPDFLLEFANNGTKITPDSDIYEKLKEKGYITGDYPKSDELNGYFNNFSNWINYLKYKITGDIQIQVQQGLSNSLGKEISGANYTVNNAQDIASVTAGAMVLDEVDDSTKKIYLETNVGYNLGVYDITTDGWKEYGAGGIMATGIAAPSPNNSIYLFYFYFNNKHVWGGDIIKTGINIIATIRSVEDWDGELYMRSFGIVAIGTNGLPSISSEEDLVIIENNPIVEVFDTLAFDSFVSPIIKGYVPGGADISAYSISFNRVASPDTLNTGFNKISIDGIDFIDGAYMQRNYSQFQFETTSSTTFFVKNNGDDLESGIAQPLYYYYFRGK